MKTALLVGGVLLVSAAIWRWRSRRDADSVSDAWLLQDRIRADRMGVDLPRWRTPKERAEMARRDRLASITDVRPRRRA